MKTLMGVLAVLVVGLTIFFSSTPSGKETWNNWFFDVQKADDSTSYEKRKLVEDTARAMISNYEVDKMTYEQNKKYCETEQFNQVKCDLADASKTRANKVALTYNNYILKNSFVWSDNIPQDINIELAVID